MAISRDGLSTKLGQFLKDQSWRNDGTKPGTAQLVCLRGCEVNADGSLSLKGDPQVYTDQYDDVMVVFGQKANGSPYLEAFRASAKPGLAWIHDPSYASSSAGCPTVQPGQYAYVRGDHRGHEAMRQAKGAPVCVIRDLDDDGRLELSDRVDYPLFTGINIHAGGAGAKVGRNSSGCQVIWGGWGGAPWTSFHRTIYKVAKGQTVFHYTLADFAFFGQWHDSPAERKSTYAQLRFGAYGARVKDLQQALAQKGFYGGSLVDGEFGRVTDEGVRAFQKSKKLRPDGVVTAELMAALTA